MRDNIIIGVLLAGIAGVIYWGVSEKGVRSETIRVKKEEFEEWRTGEVETANTDIEAFAAGIPPINREASALEEEVDRIEQQIKDGEERHTNLTAERDELQRALEAQEEEEALVSAAAGDVAAEFAEARDTRDNLTRLKADMEELEEQRCQEALGSTTPEELSPYVFRHASSPYGAALLFALGELYRSRGNFAGAITSYDRLVRQYSHCDEYVRKAVNARRDAKGLVRGNGLEGMTLELCSLPGRG